MFFKEDFRKGARAVPVDGRLAEVRDFCAEHATALLRAARLLGGEAWARRARGFLDRIRTADRLTTPLLRELVALHRLLMLDGVEDLESAESACFAAIDPADSIVHELCCIADAVGALLAQIDGLDQRGADVA